jgi:D-lactate dehydrogenase (cytochrome)
MSVWVPVSPVDSVVSELAENFGTRLSRARGVRSQHGRDEGWHAPAPPDAVVFAQNTDDVVAVVRACARHAVPLNPSTPAHPSKATSPPFPGESASTLHR